MTGPTSPKLLPPVDLPGLARVGLEAVQSVGAKCALIGGAAIQAYGLNRATKDVDFALTRQGAAALESSLRERGETVAPLKIGGFSISRPAGHIDFIDRRHGPFALFEEAVNAAERTQAHVEAEGVIIPVVPLEYLVALKMVGARPRDEADLDYLLRRPELDYPEVRSLVLRHLGEIVARYLDRAARLAGRADAPRDYDDGS